MDWRNGIARWGRGAAPLALLGVLWLLAGPKGESVSPSSFSGPGLESARGSTTIPAGRAATGGAASARPKRYVVHVAGAVRHPGVYRVHAPGRLIDAVKRAGGLTRDADLTQVNLAARLTDGRQIVVPVLASSGGVGTGGGTANAPPAGASVAVPGAKVALNSATAEQLDGLEGVGPAMAAAIIALRTKLGGFTRIEQLDDVPGVGEKRLATLRGQLEL